MCTCAERFACGGRRGDLAAGAAPWGGRPGSHRKRELTRSASSAAVTWRARGGCTAVTRRALEEEEADEVGVEHGA